MQNVRAYDTSVTALNKADIVGEKVWVVLNRNEHKLDNVV